MDDPQVHVELIPEKRALVSDEAGQPVVDDLGHRLGRHIEHDPRSWDYQAPQAPQLITTLHQRFAPIFDQGQLGSCTGNAMTGLLATAPHVPHAGVTYDENLAVKLYELATHLDQVPGSYPPDDTGSTGLAVAKAARQLGLSGGYKHAFGLQHALAALVLAPVIVGVPWYDSFDQPDLTKAGLVSISPSAQVRGGHEIEVLGIDTAAQTIRLANSWGTGWGDQGYFTMGWATLDELLHEQGDVVTVH